MEGYARHAAHLAQFFKVARTQAQGNFLAAAAADAPHFYPPRVREVQKALGKKAGDGNDEIPAQQAQQFHEHHIGYTPNPMLSILPTTVQDLSVRFFSSSWAPITETA